MQNFAPTQSHWDEVYSLLSYPLFSERSIGWVRDGDPNFDFAFCDDDVEKGAQYLNLLCVLRTRFIDASAMLTADFFEACSSQILPYMAVETLDYVVRSYFSVFSAHPYNQIRLADSIAALMKARSTTPEHTQA